MNTLRTALALLIAIPAIAMAQADPSTAPAAQTDAAPVQLSPEVTQKLQDDKVALTAARTQLRTDREAGNADAVAKDKQAVQEARTQLEGDRKAAGLPEKERTTHRHRRAAS